MVKHNSCAICVYLILSCMLFSLSCEADESPRLHIVYMGSLPKTPYSPTSHHLTMLQQVAVVDGNNIATNSILHSYKRSFNGFAAMLTEKQRQKLTHMEEVVSIFPSRTLQTHTTRSWDFIGLPLSTKENIAAETDVVIGVIDSGIWPESESFSDKGFGPIPKKWKGTCAGGKNFTCNKKIIGARSYVEVSARDNIGHGTHTSSIAAGNKVENVSFYGLAQGTARGGAPSARVAAYKACDASGDCSDASILAAFDDAIADGVDIISISLGPTWAREFHEDAISIGSFHAMERGILTVNSAGNAGPVASSVDSVAPWLLTVASSTIDRLFIDKVLLGNGKALTGNSVNAFMSNGTKFPIAIQNGNSSECPTDKGDLCLCVDSNLVNGKIVLCGNNIEGLDFAHVKGAIGGITEANGDIEKLLITSLPSLVLNSHDFAYLKSYLNSTNDPRAEILRSETILDHTAPLVADFSSRGPNIIVQEILKPDITAPGVDILAAYSPIASLSSGIFNDQRSAKYSILSGTSMACPHVAGIAAYVKTFHPNWSPAAIKSAIMTSAKPMNGSKSEIGEYAHGSGHVNPTQAVDPGLVYDIGKDDYIQMLCNFGYDNAKIKNISGDGASCSGVPNRSLISNLNYPALVAVVQPNASFNVGLKRTVTNVGSATSNYSATILPIPQINITVEPMILSFTSLNEKQSFVVTITGENLRTTDVLTSSLVWSDGTHNVRIPIVLTVSSFKKNVTNNTIQ
ncbi:hypothetical protein RJT34_00256 [Clitoria ternatea]|uniref:Cucumisin n=1 Tax=Clitoria ternatea TaxID=43366 RepID=A0AAN9PZ68_CLITE